MFLLFLSQNSFDFHPRVNGLNYFLVGGLLSYVTHSVIDVVGEAKRIMVEFVLNDLVHAFDNTNPGLICLVGRGIQLYPDAGEVLCGVLSIVCVLYQIVCNMMENGCDATLSSYD